MKSLNCLPIFIISCLALTGCNKYYMPVKSVQPPMESMKESIEEKRYFILRVGSSSFAMNNIQLSDSDQLISCELGTLPIEHMLYIKSGSKKKKYFYDNKPNSVVLNETHLYAPHFSDTLMGKRTSISDSSIIRIENIEFDKKTTKSVNTFGIIYISAAAVALTIGIVVVSSMDWGD